ncbi:MAG: flagellar biosynthetic protein FliO [Cellvibrionaceae bacterium]
MKKLTLLLVLFSCAPVFAQVQDAVKSSTPMPNQGAYMMQVLLGLLFVIGLVFALAWILKRVGQGSLVGGQQMKVVAAMPMGTRERIVLVDVGGQHILLGVTATQINSLHVFDEPVDLSRASESAPTDFSAKLKEILTKGTEKS